MGSTLFGDLYEATVNPEEGQSFERQIVPAGQYDVQVEGARPYTGGKSPMIFLTLSVLNGPLAGKKSDVSIVFATGASSFYFHKKTKGLFAYPDALGALQAASSLDDETGLALIAESLKGKIVRAEISIEQKPGTYKGSNNLDRTEAPAVAAAAPVATQAAQPAAQPFVGAPAPAAAVSAAPESAVVTVPW